MFVGEFCSSVKLRYDELYCLRDILSDPLFIDVCCCGGGDAIVTGKIVEGEVYGPFSHECWDKEYDAILKFDNEVLSSDILNRFVKESDRCLFIEDRQ
jgi:hypothetical protein